MGGGGGYQIRQSGMHTKRQSRSLDSRSRAGNSVHQPPLRDGESSVYFRGSPLLAHALG